MNPKPQHPKPAQVLGCWVARAGTHSRKNRRDFPVSNSLHSQAVQVAPTISSQSQARFGTAVPNTLIWAACAVAAAAAAQYSQMPNVRISSWVHIEDNCSQICRAYSAQHHMSREVHCSQAAAVLGRRMCITGAAPAPSNGIIPETSRPGSNDLALQGFRFWDAIGDYVV